MSKELSFYDAVKSELDNSFPEKDFYILFSAIVQKLIDFSNVSSTDLMVEVKSQIKYFQEVPYTTYPHLFNDAKDQLASARELMLHKPE